MNETAVKEILYLRNVATCRLGKEECGMVHAALDRLDLALLQAAPAGESTEAQIDRAARIIAEMVMCGSTDPKHYRETAVSILALQQQGESNG